MAARTRTTTSHPSAQFTPRPDHPAACACPTDHPTTAAPRTSGKGSRSASPRVTPKRDKRGGARRAHLTLATRYMPSMLPVRATVPVDLEHATQWRGRRGAGRRRRGRRRRRRRRPPARARNLAHGLCLEAHVWGGMGMYLSERGHVEREETMARLGQKTCFFERSRGRETWRTSIRALRPVLVCVPEVPPTGRHARRARRRLDAAQGALRGSKRARGAKGQKGAGEGGRLTFDLSWTSEFLVFRPRACCS